MDALAHDNFHWRHANDVESRDLQFLVDEGLNLLASYSKITDSSVRRALAGLVDALAQAEPDRLS